MFGIDPVLSPITLSYCAYQAFNFTMVTLTDFLSNGSSMTSSFEMMTNDEFCLQILLAAAASSFSMFLAEWF